MLYHKKFPAAIGAIVSTMQSLVLVTAATIRLRGIHRAARIIGRRRAFSTLNAFVIIILCRQFHFIFAASEIAIICYMDPGFIAWALFAVLHSPQV
jgi:hypothetical protein